MLHLFVFINNALIAAVFSPNDKFENLATVSLYLYSTQLINQCAQQNNTKRKKNR